MKTKLRFLATAVVAASTLWLCTLPVRAQNTVISAAEFQRMVYSGHLLTQFSEKPELDACLQVLLEMQRRNPNADPAALAAVLREATTRYRTNAPAYIRTLGYRDEILAAYLDALRQVAARTNFVPATLSLLNHFMLGPADYTNASPAELIHSGNQRLLASEGDAGRQQTLVDTCASRAQGNAAFAAAMDGLLFPETLVSLAHTPANIIGSTNSALHGNLTFQTLLALSLGSGNGSLTVSSNQLMNLFTNETLALWRTIQTNLALEAEFNQSHPDLLAFLGDQSAIDANVQRTAAIREGQPRTIASSTAAILVQSKLIGALPSQPGLIPKLPGWMQGTADGLASIADGFTTKNKVAGGLKILSGALSIFGAASSDGGESADDAIVREIGNVKTLIQDLSTNVNYRFDRVDQSLVSLDQSLNTIFKTLNTEFDKITIEFIAQRLQITSLNLDVNEIRRTLVDAQTDLHRLERQLFTLFNAAQRNDLLLALNGALFWETDNPGPMSYAIYSQVPNGPENTFYTYATTLAQSAASSPASFSAADLASTVLKQQLDARPLDANLNYLKAVLAATPLNQSTAGASPLPNPRDWFTSAYAYLQLAVENPVNFRTKGLRVPAIISNGDNLINFVRSLTFTGTNINWPLYAVLTNYYAGKLPPFLSQVQTKEQEYATSNSFALNTWRQWSGAAPRVTTTATEILTAPQALPPIPGGAIAAGGNHILALKANGTVVGWGFNDFGQTTIPASATNVVAIAAGNNHSLALKANGTVVGWGENRFGQTTIPASATNVVAIAEGLAHSLALKANGTVVGWGYNANGQTTIPASATNVLAIAAGGTHSLALKADGTVVGWGNNGYGQTTIPASATNVVAIAEGGAHSLALKANGTVVGWGDNSYGQTTIPASATNVVAIAAGNAHSLALKADGTVVGWGWNDFGQATIPASATNVVAIAAGDRHSLALKADGTVVGWGDNNYALTAIPTSAINVVAIAAGVYHSLALKAGGTVVGWGRNGYGETTIPASATNVLAIAAGGALSLALKADGTVVGWGLNDSGQATIPASATNVVAIAVGDDHSLALKADGTVVGWGNNIAGETTIPASATNVVAIATCNYHSLALKADGTVVGWGYNGNGAISIPASATNVVAIAAGRYHSLALKADGTVVNWGDNTAGQTTIPASATNVVAIAAGNYHSLALKADGTVIGWGDNSYGQTTIPASATNVVAIATGDYHSLFLKGRSSTNGGTSLSLVRAQIPRRVGNLLRGANERVLTELGLAGTFRSAATELSGPKALLQAVLELGMPYTLERDDVLHGFFYGNEALADLSSAETFLQAEITKLQANPEARPQALPEVAVLRYQRFAQRLNERLLDLQAIGQPELPRLVGHTLRLLNLLRDSWSATPPSALEVGRATNGLGLALYGEPYARYTLLQSSNLNNWTSTSITNLRSADSPIGIVNLSLPTTGSPARYYRAAQPVP